MIIYEVQGRKVIARFKSTLHNNDYNQWLSSIDDYVASKVKFRVYSFLMIADELKKRTNFTGVAVCHEDDEFDLEYGKQLAKERLLAKYSKVRDRCYNKVIKRIQEIPFVHNYIKRNKRYAEAIDIIYYTAQSSMLLDELIEKGKYE